MFLITTLETSEMLWQVSNNQKHYFLDLILDSLYSSYFPEDLYMGNRP